MRTWMVGSLLVSLGACQTDGAAVWRFSIEETVGSVQHAYALAFEERIEGARPDIDVKVYPYGALGTSDQTTELLHNGTLELAMMSPGHTGTLIPEVQVLLLHFVLSDDAEVNRRALQDPKLHRLLDDLYAEKGLALMSIFSEGWMVWTLDRPVRHPSDFRGVKMRVMTSPLMLAAYEAYGASPTPLPYGEVYGALQLGMVDGQVNPVFAIQEMSFYEVTDYLVFPGHAPYVETVAANRAFLAGLPADLRELLDETVAELRVEIDGIEADFNRERLELIRKRRPDIREIVLTDDERVAFRAAARTVREQFFALAPRQGQEVLDALVAAVASAEREVAQEQGQRGE